MPAEVLPLDGASRPPWFGALPGLVLAGVAVALPASTLSSALSPAGQEVGARLLAGGECFRYGLVALGLYAAALGWLPSPAAGASAVRPEPAGRGIRVALGLLLVAAAGLRFHALGTGLWYDEILMHVSYMRLSLPEILTTYDSQNQHFLYTLLARVVVDVLGDSAWALRLPAALFGVGGVAALYLVARQVVAPREALLAAALMTVSYHHVWFSQNARGYTGVLFWALLSSHALLRALQDGRRRWWVLYAVTAALGAYTHLTMVFVMAGQGLVYLGTCWRRRGTRWPSRWEGLLVGFPLAALLTFQLHALVLPQVLAGVADEASPVGVWRHPLWALVEFMRGMRIGFSGSAVAIAALLVFLTGLSSLGRRAPAVVALLVVPVALCAAVVIGSGHHLWPRFFFFAMGFGILVVVRGAAVLGESLGRGIGLGAPRATMVGVATTLALVAGSGAAVSAAYAPKQDYDAALAFVEARRGPSDAVGTAGLASLPFQRFYRVDWQSVDSVESLARLRAGARRTWMVYTLPLHLDAVRPELMASLRQDFRVIQTFPGTLSGGAIVVCRVDDTAGGGTPAGAGGPAPVRSSPEAARRAL